MSSMFLFHFFVINGLTFHGLKDTIPVDQTAISYNVDCEICCQPYHHHGGHSGNWHTNMQHGVLWPICLPLLFKRVPFACFRLCEELSAAGPFCLIYSAYVDPCVLHVTECTNCDKCASEIWSVFHPCAGAMLTHECFHKSFRLLLAFVEQGLHMHPFCTASALLDFTSKFWPIGRRVAAIPRRVKAA